MKKTLLAAASALLATAVFSCSENNSSNPAPAPEPETQSYVWEFDNADGWVYFHQDTATIDQWAIVDGKLALTTRANTYDRTKMHTADNDYAAGTYKWRTYVPAIAPGEQVSVGSWIYCDDHHELDFEVGYGTAASRAQCGAGADDLVACMTNQDFPFKSGYTPVKAGWHDYELKLDVGSDGKYTAIWSIDGSEKQRLKLGFGPEYGFALQCSVENLKFLGDKIPASDYTGLFDRVSFDGTKSTSTTH